jgi:hypothetical protein
MTFDAQHLYELMPEIYRVRDDALGGPLRELLSVIADQVAVVEESLDQLYDDQFIETCADWVVPYIGSLIGYRSLHGEVPRISSPRAEVAHTIGFRRRKGTAAMLEQLARDVTSWNANVVEYFLRLGTTQYLNHIRPGHSYAPDMGAWEPLERIGGPFDDLAHTVDVRHIGNGTGRHNIPNIGIFLWRLDAFSLTASPAVQVDPRRYRFSPLGNDAPLFTNPEPEVEISHLARPLNVPEPISRRVLDARLAELYARQRSLVVGTGGADVAIGRVVAADLSDAGGGAWAHKPIGVVAIDPVLGRIAFAEDEAPPTDVRVSYHYGFAGEIGGGEYDRQASVGAAPPPVQSLVAPALIQPALDARQGGGTVVLADSGRYEETISILANAGAKVELDARDGARPTLVLAGDLAISGGADAEVTLDGLLITGGRVVVPAAAGNALRRLRLRHCTLVPGSSLTANNQPEHPERASVVVEARGVTLEIDHSIVGAVRVSDDSNVVVSDSIVDATTETEVAYAAVDGSSAGGMLQVINGTIIGKVRTVLLEYASNAVFLAQLAAGDTWPQAIRSERRQAGCVRFSFLDRSAHVPRRYRCQPDHEIETEVEERERAGTPVTAAQRAQIVADVSSWLVPRLTSTRYGDPGYGQLHESCPGQIRSGADDEAEMGAFHGLYEPQRETNVRVRLDEYLRFGLEAGIFYAS